MLRRQARLLGIAGVLLLLIGCGAGSSAFRRARKAELRKDYDTALIEYQKALQSEPDNAYLVLHEKVARTEAALFHLKEGRRLRAAGRPDEATGEFQKAVGIDPTNQAAAQELASNLAVEAATKRERQGALEKALKGRGEATEIARMKLKPFPPGVMAHFRISADSRRVFETLAKLADLNVAFAFDFQPRPLSIDLTNVKVEDALRVVTYQTRTFWKTVTPNTFLVIPDTPNNRRDYEEEVLKTVYLSNPLAPADRTQILTALKQILLLQRVVDNPDSNAIIIRDTPAKVEAAEKLIRDLDRGKAEILIDVAVVEADRDRVRDLGLAYALPPPASAGMQAAIGFTPRVTTTNAAGFPSIGLNRVGRISSADFSVVLPSAVAFALLNDSRTHILQKPQVRVTDGHTAKLKIGSRFPYATGSFLPSFGGGITGGTGGTTPGLGILAGTQFQYQDVGVNLELTPHLLSNGEVALHASIEISSVGQMVTIGGLQEPSFGQRRIDHDIRLKEGEINLLGGLIESSTIRSVSGLPVLGQIPGLRYLFSTEHTDRVETEVLVMLTPRVIRLPEIPGERGRDVPVGSEVKTPGTEVPPAPELPRPGGEPQ